MIFIGAIIAIALFLYFQKKTSDRNMQHFENSRERYEQLLEQLRNARDKDEQGKTDSDLNKTDA